MQQSEKEPLSVHDRILSQKDLYEILPFGETKVKQLLSSGALPMVRIGKDYVCTFNMLEEWLKEHVGKEIMYVNKD